MKCKIKSTPSFSRINQIKLFISVHLIYSPCAVYSKEILESKVAKIYLFHFQQSCSCVRKCNLDTCMETVITISSDSPNFFFIL